MIFAIGIDIVHLYRIEQMYHNYGERFLKRILSPQEIARMPQKRQIEYIGGRFAIKEAIIKAINCTTSFAEIEILNDASGKPYVATAKEILLKAGINYGQLHVSISHDGDIAIGFAIIEKISPQQLY
ncbi:MAG: holo-ACP synthase [Spirochaetes bacterium]|nr:holo-ACP synthase [Spirochaetota bacterium]